MIDCVKCLLLCVIYVYLYQCSSIIQGGANSQLPFALVFYPLYLFLLLHHKPSYHLLTFYSCDDCFPPLFISFTPIYVHPFTFLYSRYKFFLPQTTSLPAILYIFVVLIPIIIFSTSFLPLLHPLPVSTLFLPPSHCPSICRVRLPRQLVCQLANICPHH